MNLTNKKLKSVEASDAPSCSLAGWERRLQSLTGHPKVPEAIAKDVICALHELAKLRQSVQEQAAALRETLAVLNHSDTSYPVEEGWWSYERSREMESLISPHA